MRNVTITPNGYLAQLATDSPAKHKQVLKLLFNADPNAMSLAEERQFTVRIAGQHWS